MVAAGRAAGGKYPDQRVRLDEFRDDHPGIAVCESEFRDGWDADIPLDGGGERFLHRGDLAALLDDTESILAGGDPRARLGLPGLRGRVPQGSRPSPRIKGATPAPSPPAPLPAWPR